jgi:hypothetical protein
MRESPSGTKDDRCIPQFPAEAMHQSAEDLARLRSLTMQERGDMLIAACQAAVEFLEGRARSGLPPPTPAPWPRSTVELFKRFAPNARRK